MSWSSNRDLDSYWNKNWGRSGQGNYRILDGAIHADIVGSVGGIWLLWNPAIVEVTKLASVGQEIHVVVTVSSSHLSSLLFSIYASPKCSELCIFWTNLAKFASTMFVVAYGRRLWWNSWEDKFPRGIPLCGNRTSPSSLIFPQNIVQVSCGFSKTVWLIILHLIWTYAIISIR